MTTLADRLQASIDDVLLIAKRHANDRQDIHDDICALYRQLLAHKRKAETSAATNRNA